jgi:hypothetical protein
MDHAITLGDVLWASLGGGGGTIIEILGFCLFILSVIASGYRH